MALFENTDEYIPEKDILFRALMVLIGFGIAVSGGTTSIMYLNLLPIGYSFTEYLDFISHRLECYLFPIGLFIIWISIYFPAEIGAKR